MELNVEKMFQMQKALDRYIEQEHQLAGADLFDQRVLALLVEISELANETRCFKFWSKKGPSEQSVILEEFVDGVHFILSLGLLSGFENTQPAWQAAERTLTGQFLFVMDAVQKFHAQRTKQQFEEVIGQYFLLGEMLGFQAEDVEKAYIAKNEVNYERQKSGY